MLVGVFQFFGVAPKMVRSHDSDHHHSPHFVNIRSTDWKRRLPYWQTYTNRERFADYGNPDNPKKMPFSLLGD